MIIDEYILVILLSISVDSPIIIALIALMGTIINSFVTNDKQTKKDAIEQEHRLTDIESAIKYKVDPLWNMIEKTFPKLAEREDTPDLDILLRKYREAPESMSEDELMSMLTNLESELTKITNDESLLRGRGVVLAFLSVPVRARLDSLKRERLCK
jgi:hypothetical protein